MTNQLFEAALGIKSPWFVQAVAFDASQRRLTVGVDFAPGSRFAHPTTPGEHPVYDTQIKRLRHLNFFVAVRSSHRGPGGRGRSPPISALR